MNLIQLILILNFFINCDAYNMFFSICNAALNTFVEDLQYISLRSPKSITNHSCKDVSLVIFKGSNIKAEHYIGASKTIQKIGLEQGLNIDIKIPHFSHIPFVKHMNCFEKKSPSFALGHSSGAYDFLLYNNIKHFDGFIQIGSVLNSKGKLPWKAIKLEEFPIPIMTIVGKKDGYLRYLYCLDELYEQNEIEKYITKPVIVLNNITHLHLSNTTSSNVANMIGLKDFTSSITTQNAWDILALSIVDFIALNSNHTAYDSSIERMKDNYNKTQNLLRTYSKFDNIENLKGLLSVLHMSLNQLSYNDIYYNNYFDFLSSKPANHSMYFFKENKRFPTFSKMYYKPLWIKTKYNVYISAKKINKFLFQKIMNYYNIDTKMKVVFQPDKVCHTTVEWLMTDIKINIRNNTCYIQSPIFITNNDTIIYKKYYYFKMLSPAQIFELINIDLQDYN